MKPIYRCEYCDFTGVEEEVLKHEENCHKNYNLKSCLTCKHCKTDGFKIVECKQGREILEGKMYIGCSKHEVGEVEVVGIMKTLFGDFLSKEK